MNNFYREEWDKSHKRLENNILFPKEEVVKFLNRYIRKLIDKNRYKDLIITESGLIKGLDFGCGFGRQTILMKEFHIDAYGCDISSVAIDHAQKLSNLYGFDDLKNKFIVINDDKLNFENDFFNFSIAEACLDSMEFELAKKLIKEIARVTQEYIFFSVISGDDDHDDGSFSDDLTVNTEHEFGTIQSYYTYNKICDLISDIDFQIVYCRETKVSGYIKEKKSFSSRFYVVIKRQ